MVEFYGEKLVQSGHILEYYNYEREIGRKSEEEKQKDKDNPLKEPKQKTRQSSVERIIENRLVSLHRAKTNIRRLINANSTPGGMANFKRYFKRVKPVKKHLKPFFIKNLRYDRFMTLTFAENLQDISKANYLWKTFRQRLEYDLNLKLKYIAVTEFQERGAIHFHIILFNLPDLGVSYIEEKWREGRADIKTVYNVDNLGAYVSKYLTKDLLPEDDRLRGKKTYFCSKGLVKPQEITDPGVITNILQVCANQKVWETTVQNEIRGTVKYKQFNLRLTEEEIRQREDRFK